MNVFCAAINLGIKIVYKFGYSYRWTDFRLYKARMCTMPFKMSTSIAEVDEKKIVAMVKILFIDNISMLNISKVYLSYCHGGT